MKYRITFKLVQNIFIDIKTTTFLFTIMRRLHSKYKNSNNKTEKKQKKNKKTTYKETKLN